MKNTIILDRNYYNMNNKYACMIYIRINIITILIKQFIKTSTAVSDI